MGDYRVLSRIGEGGMGVVYLAQLPGGPRVALKVIRRDIVGDDEGRLRLAREVNSLRLIRSERIAEIVDADPWGPVPFVATRYVPGLSLHDHVREEGPIGGADLIWFAHCLASAIEAVHQAGVVHRDIKPANVVMEGRSPVLIDFGLARLADDPRLTVTGWLLGTPGYLSPEVLCGDEATPASDVHSWAATVTFAGTGLPPYGTGPAEAVTDRVRRGHHSLTGLPAPLTELVGACLAVKPDARPSLAEVRAALDELRARPTLVEAPVAAASSPPPTMPLAAVLDAQASAETTAIPEPATMRLTEPRPTAEPTTELAVAGESGGIGAARPLAPTAAYTVAYQPVTDEAVVPPRPLAHDEFGPPEVVVRPGSVAVPAGASEVQELGAGPEKARPTIGHRLRHGLLLCVGLGAIGLWMAAYPYLTLAAGLVTVWLLRGLWHTGAAHRGRRDRRGTKWYDVPHTVISTPVHLFTTLPGSLMLMAWAGGIGLAAGLLAFAVSLGPAETLLVIGATTALSAWWGPGGAEVRGALQPVTLRLARGWLGWLLTLAVLLGIAGLALMALDSGGINWAPATEGPLSAPPGGVHIPDWLR